MGLSGAFVKLDLRFDYAKQTGLFLIQKSYWHIFDCGRHPWAGVTS